MDRLKINKKSSLKFDPYFAGHFCFKDYVLHLKNYNKKNPRLEGFKKLQKAGLRIPNPLIVVTNAAFAEYKKKGITSNLKEAIINAFLTVRKENPKRAIIIRRAYVIPGLKDPPGPHSPFLTKPEVAISAVKEIFDFAVKNKFDKKDSEICAWIQPVIDDWEYKLIGGCATPSIENKTEVIIEAIYGEDEGVQSCPHDIYTVNFKENLIQNKEIQHKIQYIKYSETKLNIKETPKEFQDRQVLNDLLILQIANDFAKLIKKFGTHRIEFTYPKEEGIFYTECIPFDTKKKAEKTLKTEGEVLVISEIEDVDAIKKNHKIIFINPQVLARRDRNLLTALAVNAPHQMIILYPGTASTVHAATIFRELGHKLVFVPDEVFQTGEKVSVYLEAGELKAKKVTGKNILGLTEIKDEDFSIVGGKAANLARLKNGGFRVPDAFVITTLVQEKISPDLEKEVFHNFQKLKTKKVAIRSSATCEDQKNISFAGQFESYLSVPEKGFIQAIKKCWKSCRNQTVLNYARHHHISHQSIKMAVIVQEMIFAEKGGVIFTKDALKNDSNHLTIEAASGLGENVVSGIVNPERVVVKKMHKQVIEKLSLTGKVLTDKEINELIEIGLKIEKFYGSPQDIEWAIKNNQIYILQSRPITA